MGKKERKRKIVHKQAVKKLSEKDNLKKMFSGEIMRLRTDAVNHRSKLNETLVQFSKELAKIRTEITVMSKTLKDNGIVTSNQLDVAYRQLQEQTQGMFEDNGSMKGNPVVTCYNTSFSIDTTDAKVEYVYTLTGSEDSTNDTT